MINKKEIFEKNLDRVLRNIEQARLSVDEHSIIKLVAVSKYSSSEDIEMLYRLGQRAFGENHIQQLGERKEELKNLPLEWHMLGHIQTNKINKLIELKPSLIHSLDSVKLAVALNEKLALKNIKLSALLEINSASEESKSGVELSMAKDIYQEIRATCPNIILKGVMSIGAMSEDYEVVKKSFEATYNIFDALKNEGATICSMGMSGDYELAIKCGSSMVRVGSSIFKG